MKEVKDLLKVVVDYKKYRNDELLKRENNISSSYVLAKLDFKVIENLKDGISTLQNIEKQLNDLQERIIKRNREEI